MVAAMTTSARGGVSRGLVCTALAAGALLLAPTAASAAAGDGHTATATGVAATATFKGPGTGWDGVINGRAAGTNVISTAFGDIETFCIQYNVPGATDGAFTSVAWPAGFPAKAADIAAHHNDMAGKLSDQRSENAAAQLAIWHLTDDVNHQIVPNAAIVARADQILAAAKDIAPVNSTFNVDVDVTTAKGASGLGETTVTVSVHEADGDPVVGASVNIAPDKPIPGLSADSIGAVTLADGTVSIPLPAPLTATTADITFNTVVPAGAVWAPEGDNQLVVSAGQARATMSAAQDVVLPPLAADPTPEPTAEPTPQQTEPAVTTTSQQPPAAAVEAKPTVLPHTGALAPAGAVLALLAVAGGATWRVVTLRRRNA